MSHARLATREGSSSLFFWFIVASSAGESMVMVNVNKNCNVIVKTTMLPSSESSWRLLLWGVVSQKNR